MSDGINQTTDLLENATGIADFDTIEAHPDQHFDFIDGELVEDVRVTHRQPASCGRES